MGQSTLYAPRVSTSSDALVVERLKAGDELVFAELLTDWSRSMLRLARTHVSTDASAEDVVQDTWMAVIQGIDRFEGRSSLRTWVYRILDQHRQEEGHARAPHGAVRKPVGGIGRPRADRRSGTIPRPRRSVPRWMARVPGALAVGRRARCWPARYAVRSPRHWTRCPSGNESSSRCAT